MSPLSISKWLTKRPCPLWILLPIFILPHITFQQTTGDSPPSYGTVCIRDCPTCPVVCSLPPSPFEQPYSSPPPVVHHHSPPSPEPPPPEPYFYFPPPPPSPPPPSPPPPPPPKVLACLPPPPPLLKSLPPPEYGYVPVPPSLGDLSRPPPPPFKFSNTPYSGPAPPYSVAPPHDDSYPYYYTPPYLVAPPQGYSYPYYYYASEATSSRCAHFLTMLSVSLLFFIW